MEHIKSLKRNDVLKSLQQSGYNGKTYKQIEKEVGSDIASLRNELYKIENRTTDQIDQSILPDDVVKQTEQSILPDDVMIESLMRSDLQTIINTCATNKRYQQLCHKHLSNAHFWIKKLEYEGLPVMNKVDTFKEWVKEYTLLTKFKIEARCLLQIAQTEYQNNDPKKMGFDIYNNNTVGWVPSFILDQGVASMDYKSLNHIVYKKGWYINKILINQHDVEKLIIHVLYDEFHDVKNKKEIDIELYIDKGRLYSSTLILNKIKKELEKKRTSMDRIMLEKYLFSYQLLMQK